MPHYLNIFFSVVESLFYFSDEFPMTFCPYLNLKTTPYNFCLLFRKCTISALIPCPETTLFCEKERKMESDYFVNITRLCGNHSWTVWNNQTNDFGQCFLGCNSFHSWISRPNLYRYLYVCYLIFNHII